MIIRDILYAKSKSFGDFLTAPEKIATNILSDRLDELVSNGILEKTVNKQNRLKLKNLGAELRGIFDPNNILKVLAYPEVELRGMRERDSISA